MTVYTLARYGMQDKIKKSLMAKSASIFFKITSTAVSVNMKKMY